MDFDFPQKQCTDCKRFFPATLQHFHAYKRSKDGLRNLCKECRGKREKTYQQADHERYLARFRRFRERHPERAREADRKYRQTDKGKQHAVKRQQRYRILHHEQVLQSRTRYYWSHQSDEKVRSKRYRVTHREYFRLADAIRRARLKGVPGRYTAAQIQDLLKRQRYRCYYCTSRFERHKKRYSYHIEHTFPISRLGASNDISHLVLACPTCNRKKHNKYPWEFPEGGRLL